ncbi:MAG: DNA-processing protein DprA [Legionella sp.]
MSNKPYLLALNRMPHIGPRTIAKLLQGWPNLEELFQLSSDQLQRVGLSARQASAIASFNISKVESDFRWQEQPHHSLVTYGDADYPTLLNQIPDPPPVLYAIGDLACLQRPTVAIVGSRKPSIMGGKNARRFAADLARCQITVVSGLALGIDAEAHRGCLHVNGKTVAVIGTGIDRTYPSCHQSLAEKIAEAGLLLSEFPLGSLPIAGHFPRRNRIISGLSLATLVVEAAVKSGSLITAQLALEQNREVLAVPGSIHNPLAGGCHHLLKQGARLVASYKDILQELQLECVELAANTNQIAISLASDDKNLVKWLGFDVVTVDQISQFSGWGIDKVVCHLAELELQGIVKAVAGGYMRCVQ